MNKEKRDHTQSSKNCWLVVVTLTKHMPGLGKYWNWTSPLNLRRYFHITMSWSESKGAESQRHAQRWSVPCRLVLGSKKTTAWYCKTPGTQMMLGFRKATRVCLGCWRCLQARSWYGTYTMYRAFLSLYLLHIYATVMGHCITKSAPWNEDYKWSECD